MAERNNENDNLQWIYKGDDNIIFLTALCRADYSFISNFGWFAHATQSRNPDITAVKVFFPDIQMHQSRVNRCMSTGVP